LKPNRNRSRDLGFYALLLVILIAVVFIMTKDTASNEIENYSELVDLFNEEKVKSFRTEGNLMILEVRTGDDVMPEEEMTYNLYSFGVFYEDFSEIIRDQYERGVIETYEYDEGFVAPWWASFLPYLLIMGGGLLLWQTMMNRTGGGAGGVAKFSKARTKLGSDEKNKKTFNDVAGCEEEKEELAEIVDFLKDPKAYTSMGARIPKGVLLVGPPGTGKTLLAKAVAGEAGVPFYSISGSDFVEMYVGVGASRVRDLFETAKKSPASIVFIDEIDAVGRHRGAGLGGGHDEREQTLNQLLVEMDGFGANEGVIVMAATNRPDILDPALLRPGRFDRQVTIGYPDLKGREDILKVHAKGKPLATDVNLNQIAKTTVGFTGADLANLLNEAALLAARKGRSLIGMDDIEAATLKIIVGTTKKSMVIKPEEKKKTAYHEAGHAIMAYALKSLDPVRMISIVPSGRALGFTLNPPTEDKYSVYKSGLKDEIAMLLGGRVAEKLIYGDISGGASNDIQRATAIAKKMVTKLGMSDDLGPIAYGGEHSSDEVFLGRDFNNSRDYSEETARRIDEEIRKLISDAYAVCEKVLTENMDKMHFIADYLVEHEVMDEDQFKVAMEKADVTEADLDAIIEEKKAKTAEENARRAEEDAKRKAEEEAKAAEEAAKAPSQNIVDPNSPEDKF